MPLTYGVTQVILLRRLLFVSLDDTELGLVFGILHHVPVNSLQPKESIMYSSVYHSGEEKHTSLSFL